MTSAPVVERTPWLLEPGITFLNHGSHGACPGPVLAEQDRWRQRMEREPVRFLGRELEGCLDAARVALAAFLGADPAGLAFVANATTGVNAVLSSLRFAAGDELLTTDHEYNAVLNALRRAAARDRAGVVVARVPFQLADPEEVVDAVLAAVTSRTRFALISHVTSPTGVVFPVARLAGELAARGVELLVDGAHAPGMVPLGIDELAVAGVAWYTGNGHKWLCGPKGSGFLWAREDVRARTHPSVTSHGANDRRPGRSTFHKEFDWVGTADPTAYLSLPAAISYIGGLVPGGWTEVMAANRSLALRGRDLVCGALGSPAPVPDAMIGSMASLALDIAVGDGPALQQRLYDEHRIEVPITRWPVDAALEPGETARCELLRVSAQRYNSEDDYARLASALAEALAMMRSSS